MSDLAFEVEILDMWVGGIPGRHVVAKVGRISSPPIAADAVPDPRASALARLADVLRGGIQTRAYADYVAYKSTQREEQDAEWAGYVAAACRALGCERLDPLELIPLPVAATEEGLKVAYHEAQMNGRPYVVSRVGPILGGPAACLLLDDPAPSGLDRLADTLRAGTEGRCFVDLLAERAVAEVASEWQRYGGAVAEELAARNGVGPWKDEWITDENFRIGGLYRYVDSSAKAELRPGIALAEGDVVRVLSGPAWSPLGMSVVRIGDRETGAELGFVSAMALRPL